MSPIIRPYLLWVWPKLFLQYDLAESTWMVEEANAVQRNWQHHSE
jgi:hypothetical protein